MLADGQLLIYVADAVSPSIRYLWSEPKEGVIIECPLIHLFHDARDVILTSRNDIRGINDDDDEMSIFTIKRR